MLKILSVMVGLMWAGAALAQTGSLLTEGVATADVVILGEVHDNPVHHEGQAVLIIQAKPKAVVFEMLTPDMADAFTAATDTPLSERGFVIGWEEAGWPDFAMYLPVFNALGDAAVIGAAAPRETVRAAFSEGAAGAFGEGAARFGLNQLLPLEQASARRQLQFDAHCAAMPMDMMGGMVEAQRFRDAHFAAVTLDALETHGGPVVVITGNGHARKDWGMPHMIARAAPDVTVLSIGFVEEPAEQNDPRFDATFVTKAAPRGDPCAAFNQGDN